MNRDSKIVKMFLDGFTLREIGREMKTSHSAIAKALKRIGVNQECPHTLLLRRKRYREKVGPKISESRMSQYRSSVEGCVMCLSSLGLGKRVISRTIGITPEMASSVLRKHKVSHERTFRSYKKLSSNSQNKLRRSLKDRVRGAMRAQGSRKNQSIVSLIGCSIQEFKSKMESIMPKKFSWENYGKVWHLDHIIPCAKFDLTKPEEVAICFHWTNYRPLEASKNIKERDRKGIQQQQLLRI